MYLCYLLVAGENFLVRFWTRCYVDIWPGSDVDSPDLSILVTDSLQSLDKLLGRPGEKKCVP